MCKNCGIVSSAFQAAQAEHFAALHAMLNTMVKNGQLQLLAGDCPLEDMPMCCVRKNITRCAFIWSVPPAGKCSSSAAASGASQSHDHHFKWWFEYAPIRGEYLHA